MWVTIIATSIVLQYNLTFDWVKVKRLSAFNTLDDPAITGS